MTDDSAFKKQVRARMAEAGEKYTVARRVVIAGRDPGRPPVVLRVYLNPHVDLEAGRLRAELEELTGKPVLLSIGEPGPQGGPGEAGSGCGS